MSRKGFGNRAISAVKAMLSNTFPARLARIERTLARLEYFSNGSRATFVGNNRLLVKIVVANANIAYYVEADDKLLTPWFVVAGGYETELTDFFVRELRHDSHCIDVGANFGYFTCLMARFAPAGRVIGIEPDRKIFELVRDNIAINGFGAFATAIHAAAAADEAGLTFYRRTTRSGNTSIVSVGEDFTSMLGEPPAEQFAVRTIAIDQLTSDMRGRVDLMKVDVEGSEPLVFAGARSTIADNPQLRIVMEWSPGQISGSGFDVTDFLRDLAAQGLAPFDIAPTALVPLSYDELLNAPYRAGIVLKRSP